MIYTFQIDFTFLWTAINLLIIYYVVNKYLFKRLGVFMEKRSASISADLDKAEAYKREGEEFRRKQDEILTETYNKQKAVVEEARLKASKEYDNIINEAKREAAHIIQRAREEGERERDRLDQEMRQNIASLAITVASKVIEANMDNEKNRDLVNGFLSKEGAA